MGLARSNVLDHKDLVQEERKQRTGFVALSGRPNAGKSTLLNAILGQEISIVTSKPQTTRNRIIGIHNVDDAQIILVDTPGISKGQHELGRRMMRGASEAAADADVVVRVIDAAKVKLDRERDSWELRRADKPTIIALNKVDLVKPKDRLLPMLQRLSEVEGVAAMVPLSALKKKAIDDLVQEIIALLPEGPPLYPPEMITDRPERFLASELVRASVLRSTRQEVPHAAAVAITSWHETDKGVHVDASIYVERKSQKSILIGRGGEMIKKIGTSARLEINRVLGCEVHLKLRVDVSSQWRTDPRALKELGYDE